MKTNVQTTPAFFTFIFDEELILDARRVVAPPTVRNVHVNLVGFRPVRQRLAVAPAAAHHPLARRRRTVSGSGPLGDDQARHAADRKCDVIFGGNRRRRRQTFCGRRGRLREVDDRERYPLIVGHAQRPRAGLGTS